MDGVGSGVRGEERPCFPVGRRIKFTVDQQSLEKKQQADEQKQTPQEEEPCLSCGA